MRRILIVAFAAVGLLSSAAIAYHRLAIVWIGLALLLLLMFVGHDRIVEGSARTRARFSITLFAVVTASQLVWFVYLLIKNPHDPAVPALGWFGVGGALSTIRIWRKYVSGSDNRR